MSALERRSEDRRIGELVHAVAELTATVKGLQEKYEDLIPEVKLVQAEARLEKRLIQLESVVEGLAKSLTTEVGKLATEVGKGMARLNDINEEVMRQQARQVDEKHHAELAKKQAEIDEMKAEATRKAEMDAKRRLDVQFDVWGKRFLLLWAVLGTAWVIWEFAVKAAMQ